MEKGEITQITHRTPYKEERKGPFITAFGEIGTVSGAAKAVGISREIVYHWLKNDPAFAQEFKDEEVSVTEELEGAALQRAIEGVDKLLIYKGQIVRDENGQPIIVGKEYSDSLIMFLLRARKPEVYRENYVRNEEEIAKEMVGPIVAKLTSILRRIILDVCPSCHTTLNWKNDIARELKDISERPFNHN